MSEHERLAGRTRWSMAVRCPRMAALALQGAEPEPLTPREEGRFQRGKDAQHFYGRKLVAKFGEENVEHEKAVPWPTEPHPLGELHTDFVISPERMAIECKSSESVDSLFDSAVTQVAGAIRWSEDIDHGAVVFLDRDYQETDMFPVILTAELAEKVDDIAAQIVTSATEGELPKRVCDKPSDGRGHLCPFIDVCFEGWVAPEIPDAEGETIPTLATQAYLARQKYEDAKSIATDAEKEWKDAAADLIEAGCPEGESTVPGLIVKRTVVADRQTFSMAKARTAGLWTSMHDELFDPFMSMGGGHSRFDFRRIDDEDLEHEDFGDEAPF